MSNELLKKMVTAMAYNDEETAAKMFQRHFNNAAIKHMSGDARQPNVETQNSTNTETTD